MAFRFKDLMIEVLPGDRANQHDTPCGTLSMDPAHMAETPCTTISQTPNMAPADCGDTGVCGTLSLPPTPYALLLCGMASATAVMTMARCPDGSLCGTLTMPGMAALGGQNLSVLKQQLQQALQQVEARERAAAEAQPGLPKTAEEADDLERRLEEALEELKEHKKTLQKPATGGTKARKGRK